MNELENEIRNLLLAKLGCEEGHYNLLIAKPVADYIGIVSEPQVVAARLFLALQKDSMIPSGITVRGVDVICNYLADQSYGIIRKAFMDAARLIKNEQ